MTQPTQAQIEAAIQAIEHCIQIARPLPEVNELAKAALTAAFAVKDTAHVEEPRQGMFNEALATAISTHAIERCALRLEEMLHTARGPTRKSNLVDAIDAVRKLKNAP